MPDTDKRPLGARVPCVRDVRDPLLPFITCGRQLALGDCLVGLLYYGILEGPYAVPYVNT